MADDHEVVAKNDERGQDQAKFPIVGIGASAGGIDALRTFFSAAKPDSGIAYVVVQHLDPLRKSILAELLGRFTVMPVHLIAQDTEVAPDNVYVIPPNTSLTILNGHLHLSSPAEPRVQRMPVDAFFTSLAQDRGETAACVILSGTGSDGTIGLRAIKECGGLSLAQADAEYDGMMRSAVATGLVDFVMQAGEMPAKLVDYFRDRPSFAAAPAREGGRDRTAEHLVQICAVLRARTGHDFSGYKDQTVIRRVQRRMQMLQVEDMPAFIERLRQDPREVDLLFHDLLIGVTSFFRDPEAFSVLDEKVIPRLFEGKGPDDAVRVWVIGCATGEEAYSIAILLRERMPKWHDAPKLQIFATDIDDHAIAIARTGRYSPSIANDVSPERLERFFVREDGTYRVSSELREICLFSLHNLLRDTPFSKLDLVTCRNLMIYLTADVQNRLIPLLHYALRENGYLMLGTSENAARHSHLFGTVDRTHHLFSRRARHERVLPEFPLTTPETGRARQAQRPGSAAPDGSLEAFAERQIIDNFAPAFVIVNAEGEALRVSGRTGKYLEVPAGTPSSNIFSMARRGLRLDLRAAFHKASSTGKPVRQSNIWIGTNGGRQIIDLTVQPLKRANEQDALYMIVFQDVGGLIPAGEPKPPGADDSLESATVRQLEAELSATKERLQTSSEELESANEELKSGNEELLSINEELQSANEELETSREELQSINEELQTVNAELKARVDELSRANNDIANLLESTQIPTLFLDRQLAVKSFTPAAKEVFRLVESDAGRPISHVRSRLVLDTVEEDAGRVLRTLGIIEKQVEGSDSGAHFIMRMLPYRTVDNVIDGVVITFTDITRVTAAEARIGVLTRSLRDRVESLTALFDLVPVGIFISEGADAQGVRVNRYGMRLLGLKGESELPYTLPTQLRLFVGESEPAPEDQPLQRAARTGESVSESEGRLLRQDGSSVDVIVSATPLFDEAGKPRGAIGVMVDITQLKQATAAQDWLLRELQHRVKNVLATVMSLATRMLASNPSLETFRMAFGDRLAAMASVHELLSTRQWEGADMRAVVETAVGPHLVADKRNVVMSGETIVLKPNAASTLGLALHELATNAAKYGALSAAGGRVEISWEAQAGPEGRKLGLAWKETDGPPTHTPESEGFGIGFVRRSVEYELGGTVEIDFQPDGLRARIEFPLGLEA